MNEQKANPIVDALLQKLLDLAIKEGFELAEDAFKAILHSSNWDNIS